MLHIRTAPPLETAHSHRYTVRFAAGSSEVREAQKLRYRVFAEEFGACLHTREPGVDRDIYDAYCQHLIVRDEEQGRIVGTYRVLPPEAAARIGNYYSENEFYLTRLEHLRPRIVEVGRSCIDPAYRSGAVIALLWAKLAEFMTAGGYGYLVGCASISMADGGHNAANLFLQLADKHMAPAEYQVAPRCPLPFEALANRAAAIVPPLLKGYLRAGAWICGEPAWDPDFNSADLLLLLPMDNLSARYRRHFVE
ncbi:MAG TPA: GNAT family N-acyltransferase [Rhodocyclaceae bacterium]